MHNGNPSRTQRTWLQPPCAHVRKAMQGAKQRRYERFSGPALENLRPYFFHRFICTARQRAAQQGYEGRWLRQKLGAGRYFSYSCQHRHFRLHLARNRLLAHLLGRLHARTHLGGLQLRSASFLVFLRRGGHAGLFPIGRSRASAALDRHICYLRRRLYCRAYASAKHGEGVNVVEFLFLFTIVAAGTGGELCVSRAMKVVGEVHDFRPAALVRFVFRAMRVGWMWIGIAMMTLAFFSLLAMLSIENVSFVVPVTALSYAAGAFGALLFLHERISPQRWLGVLIVCIGVTLVWLSRR